MLVLVRIALSLPDVIITKNIVSAQSSHYRNSIGMHVSPSEDCSKSSGCMFSKVLGYFLTICSAREWSVYDLSKCPAAADNSEIGARPIQSLTKARGLIPLIITKNFVSAQSSHYRNSIGVHVSPSEDCSKSSGCNNHEKCRVRVYKSLSNLTRNAC